MPAPAEVSVALAGSSIPRFETESILGFLGQRTKTPITKANRATTTETPMMVKNTWDRLSARQPDWTAPASGYVCMTNVMPPTTTTSNTTIASRYSIQSSRLPSLATSSVALARELGCLISR